MHDRSASPLEIDQDLDFQHRSWRAQRVGWGLMALFILAAALGLFGSGMVSRTRAGGDDAPLRLEYERFGRWGAPLEMQLHLRESPAGSARVWLSSRYLECFTVEAITPEPESAVASGDRVVYRFLVAPGQPATVTFHLTPERFGLRRGQVGLAGATPLSFRQLIFP